MPTATLVELAPIARGLGLSDWQVENLVALADEGNTVPFITRYRKERTGHLDENQIRDILSQVDSRRQLTDRAAAILRAIESQGVLTDDLRRAIHAATTLKQLEDLYLPFKPKKRTRAAAAREKGLAPLAEGIWNADAAISDLNRFASGFVDTERGVDSPVSALAGAADILAERISENAEVREAARKVAWKTGRLVTTAVDATDKSKEAFRNYFEFSQPVESLPPHRTLGLNRAENEQAIRVKFTWDTDRALGDLETRLALRTHRFQSFLRDCLRDSLDRLIEPSLDREIRRELTERAQEHAIGVFARNLRQLLLQPPLAGERIMAIDPGFRTGCKIAVLDETGNRIASDVVYVTGNAEKLAATRARLAALLIEHQCRVVAIGNGTGCRETEELVAETIAQSAPTVRYVVVNEAGASIYSTSPIANEEFPDADATERGTISIGRRLQDPLSELVKIEPQHIGVGQYQHDLDEKRLGQSLDQVVESCVNYVGVDVNTASVSLLRYVSGLNQSTARKVVEYRRQNGPFKSRRQLRDVGGVGEATFTQAAGFLKIREGEEPLDATWIHPESYKAARSLLKMVVPGEASRPGSLSAEGRAAIAANATEEMAQRLDIGLPTLRDIVDALARPGRDPRSDLPGPRFRKGVMKLEDLAPGMELEGTVLNVVDFGAFIDLGVKESGLVHISRLANHYVKHPHDVVAVGETVRVWIESVDLDRRRVSLSMVAPGQVQQKPATPAAPTTARAESPPRNVNPPSKPAGHAAPSENSLRTFGDLKKAWGDRTDSS